MPASTPRLNTRIAIGSGVSGTNALQAAQDGEFRVATTHEFPSFQPTRIGADVVNIRSNGGCHPERSEGSGCGEILRFAQDDNFFELKFDQVFPLKSPR